MRPAPSIDAENADSFRYRLCDAPVVVSASYTRSLSGSGATPPSRTKPPSSFVMASTYEPLPLLARSRYGKKDATRSRRTSTPMTPTMPPCASLMGLLYVMEGVPAHPKSTGRPQ